MTAKEMFEDLGYKLIEDNNLNKIKEDIIYENIEDENIYFDLLYKTYKTHYNGCEKNINISLHKAIHQQIKELGWLE